MLLMPLLSRPLSSASCSDIATTASSARLLQQGRGLHVVSPFFLPLTGGKLASNLSVAALTRRICCIKLLGGAQILRITALLGVT